MTILAIETSCDETSAAVVAGDKILSSITWSQIKYHRNWGGVVPNIARRAHHERLPQVVSRALSRAGANLPNSPNLPNSANLVTALAVTVGPGLAPALEAGIHYAKELALLHKIPLIPVNHLEGHLASIFARPNSPNLASSANFLSLIVSGGHTELTITRRRYSHPERSRANGTNRRGIEGSNEAIQICKHHLLGATLDDAAGECLDKVGRELGLGYPAGPVIEKLARLSSSQLYKFPLPMKRSPRTDLNFSFSGLKTAAIQTIHRTHNIKKSGRRRVKEFSKSEICNFCASFQTAVIDALLFKLKRAMEITDVKTVCLSGGVAANNQLRRRAGILVRSLGGRFYAAPKRFTGDNAAMIGLAACWAAARREISQTPKEISRIDRLPNLNFDPIVIPNEPRAIPVDPSIKSAYESDPFDPMASIRMTGRFLGSVVRPDRKMSSPILVGSLILGAGFLLLGIFQNAPLNVILGALIFLNAAANFKKRR
jgi:N6-L-threonylcarbamoyladenine synthase